MSAELPTLQGWLQHSRALPLVPDFLSNTILIAAALQGFADFQIGGDGAISRYDTNLERLHVSFPLLLFLSATSFRVSGRVLTRIAVRRLILGQALKFGRLIRNLILYRLCKTLVVTYCQCHGC
ncbi:hypothetical protein M5K25_025306 [Dendrobium thyrsiflorum]|uniref:Uncharacterized protein n=1 Tax=Dendrobium thyrsiflorum TaxID=117978 RepID=A0ABD0U466_DENTH